MELSLLDSPDHGLSDAELARRLRMQEAAPFLRLSALVGSDLKAVRCMRGEQKYLLAHPEFPRGPEAAAKVRVWLLEQKLEWTVENLEKAVAAVAAC